MIDHSSLCKEKSVLCHLARRLPYDFSFAIVTEPALKCVLKIPSTHYITKYMFIPNYVLEQLNCSQNQ